MRRIRAGDSLGHAALIAAQTGVPNVLAIVHSTTNQRCNIPQLLAGVGSQILSGRT
jgi:hypothetical protein